MIVLCATAAVNVQMLVSYAWLVQPHLEVQSSLWDVVCSLGGHAMDNFCCHFANGC